jgi:putative DNA primase/helicase
MAAFAGADVMMFTLAKATPIESELARRGITLKRAGRELVGPCPVCGGRDRFGANLRKQIWNCRQCAKGGDVIDLVRHIDGSTACEAVRMLTGMSTRSTSSTPRPTPPAPKSDDDHERRQREKARWLWPQRQPHTGSITETYLREARGYSGPLPPTLAFLPARNGKPAAMISAFAYPNEIEPGVLGDPVSVEAVHLTLLKADGTGKADINPNKIMLASPAGNPIAVAPMNDLGGLAVCEGIEDALSVHQATGLGVWAAGSAPHMAKLAPAIIRAEPACVSIFADGDEAGRRGAHELATDLARLVAMLELNIEILLCGAQS